MAMTPEISRALAELASGLNLTPAIRQDLIKQVPDNAKTEADLPDNLRFILGQLRAEERDRLAGQPARATAATTRTLRLAGAPLTFSTQLLDSPEIEMCAGMPHPDDDGTAALRAALPKKWRGLLVPYNTMAPDGRVIRAPEGEPKSRQMPLPLNVQTATAEGHDNAIPVGRVNRIWNQDGALWGEGDFDLDTPEGRDWAGRVMRQMAGWGSVDLDAGEAPIVRSQGENKVDRREYPDWTFAGFTLVTRPAFDAARITALDEGDDGDVVDDERNCEIPDDIRDIIEQIRDLDDDEDGEPEHEGHETSPQPAPAFFPVGMSNNSCGCGGAAEDDAALTFPGGGKSGLPLGERFAEWDGPAAAKRVREWAGVDGDNPDWAKYGQAFFWHAENPSKLGDFKLPFADVVGGKLTAMPRGIFAAAASMQGSRGEKPDIPGADVDGVKSKISAYYRKMKMKAPWDSNAVTASAAQGSTIAIDGGIAGTVTGFDEDGGWLRISCGGGMSVICSTDELPAESLVASASGPLAPPDEWFDDPKLSGPTALTVDDDGRVFGHLAVFGTCHTNFSDTCVQPPRSNTSYSYFHTGEVVTASGKRVAVGKITIGGGHAAPHAGWRASAAHYEKTSSTVAVIRAGEDAYGIWVAGALVPEVTATQLASLRRSPLSGDWRRIAGNLELVAALAVVVPGFPIPRARAGFASDRQASLVAAGVVDRRETQLHASLRDVVTQAVEEVLEGYAERRQRAAAASARIAQVSMGSCGESCACESEDDDTEDDEE